MAVRHDTRTWFSKNTNFFRPSRIGVLSFSLQQSSVAMTLDLLRQNCGFSEAEFADFHYNISQNLRKPKNIVGLRGIEDWLDSFIDSGVGESYWGQGTAKLWCFPTDRAKQASRLSPHSELGPTTNHIDHRIRDFVETAVILISKIVRIDATLPPLEGDTVYVAAVKPSVEGASTIKVNSPTLQRKRSLQKHTPVKLNHTETDIVILSEDNSQCRKRKKLGVPIIIDIDSDSESSTDSETPIPSNLSNLRSRAFFEVDGDQPDLVLETTVAGSGEIRLVYCPNNNLLSYFITEVRRKYRLRQDQEIVGIKVKTGDKMYNVDLDECRDWRYILGVIRKNGGKAEMVVSIN